MTRTSSWAIEYFYPHCGTTRETQTVRVGTTTKGQVIDYVRAIELYKNPDKLEQFKYSEDQKQEDALAQLENFFRRVDKLFSKYDGLEFDASV